MYGFKEDKTHFKVGTHNYETLGAVKYDDFNLNLIPVLFNSTTGIPLEIGNNTKRFISVQFEHVQYDFTKNFTGARTFVEARTCQISDFNRSE